MEKDYNKELTKNIIGMGVRERYWEGGQKVIPRYGQNLGKNSANEWKKYL